MRPASLAVLGLACSCGTGTEDWMPLATGNRWTYEVKTDFDSRVDEVRVAGRTPVGSALGFVVYGPSGESRLAWQHGSLVASELAGQFFEPPIPLLTTTKATWKGSMVSAGRKAPARAEVRPSRVKEKWAGRQVEALQVEVHVATTGRRVQLTTWFVRGMGILRQEQRTGDRRDRRIEYLSGP